MLYGNNFGEIIHFGGKRVEHAPYSDNLMKFYEFFEEDVSTARECAFKLTKVIPMVADELHLGRFDIHLKAAVSLLEAKGVDIEHTLYTNPEGYESHSLQCDFKTGEHGNVIISSYPVKGYSWTQEDIAIIKTFALNVFFICGRARLIEMIEHNAVTDNTTGICNQAGFVRYAVETMVRTGLQDYHSMRFNIKNFKIVAKRVGNNRVFDVFRSYGRAIESFIGTDGKLAHLGGDNFIALIKDEKVEDFLAFLEEVPVKIAGNEETFNLSARVGIYNNQLGDNITAIMDYIDVATVNAKNNNVDVVYFKQEMLERILHNKNVTATFPEAIDKKEFVVYYQPKVSTKDEVLCGCEALVRWIKDGKMIPPLDFIPVLEENGSVCELDFYVLDRVCADIRSWIERGITPVTTSVNFSKQHIKYNGVAEKILSTIDKYGIEHSLIEIELTEMSGYDDFDNLSAFVEKIRKAGVKVSIDDFGTGYSSLNMLTTLDVDVVKLDRSLTRCVDTEYSKTKLLLLNIVDMVHKLSFKSLAEGVETDEQLSFLKNIGCTMVQGFLYDTPLPKEDFEMRLKGEVRYNSIV